MASGALRVHRIVNADATKTKDNPNTFWDLSVAWFQTRTTSAKAEEGVPPHNHNLADFQTLTEALPKSTCTELDLSTNLITPEAVEILASKLQATTNLKKLYMRSVGNQHVGVGARGGAVFSLLLNDSPLTELDISDNEILIPGAVAIAEVLATNKCLERLVLSNCNLKDDGLAALVAFLPNNTTLKSLDVSNNNVGVQGLEALARALIANHSLEELNTGFNDITPPQQLANTPPTTPPPPTGDNFCYAVGIHERLTSLRLSNMHLTSNHVTVLAAALFVNEKSCLTSLNLEENSINEDAMISLAVVIESHPKLKKLDLGQTNLTAKQVVPLALALTLNRSVQELNMFLNSVESLGSRALSMALGANMALCSLTLAGLTPFSPLTNDRNGHAIHNIDVHRYVGWGAICDNFANDTNVLVAPDTLLDRKLIKSEELADKLCRMEVLADKLIKMEVWAVEESLMLVARSDQQKRGHHSVLRQTVVSYGSRDFTQTLCSRFVTHVIGEIAVHCPQPLRAFLARSQDPALHAIANMLQHPTLKDIEKNLGVFGPKGVLVAIPTVEAVVVMSDVSWDTAKAWSPSSLSFTYSTQKRSTESQHVSVRALSLAPWTDSRNTSAEPLTQVRLQFDQSSIEEAQELCRELLVPPLWLNCHVTVQSNSKEISLFKDKYDVMFQEAPRVAARLRTIAEISADIHTHLTQLEANHVFNNEYLPVEEDILDDNDGICHCPVPLVCRVVVSCPHLICALCHVFRENTIFAAPSQKFQSDIASQWNDKIAQFPSLLPKPGDPIFKTKLRCEERRTHRYENEMRCEYKLGHHTIKMPICKQFEVGSLASVLSNVILCDNRPKYATLVNVMRDAACRLDLAEAKNTSILEKVMLQSQFVRFETTAAEPKLAESPQKETKAKASDKAKDMDKDAKTKQALTLFVQELEQTIVTNPMTEFHNEYSRLVQRVKHNRPWMSSVHECQPSVVCLDLFCCEISDGFAAWIKPIQTNQTLVRLNLAGNKIPEALMREPSTRELAKSVDEWNSTLEQIVIDSRLSSLPAAKHLLELCKQNRAAKKNNENRIERRLEHQHNEIEARVLAEWDSIRIKNFITPTTQRILTPTASPYNSNTSKHSTANNTITANKISMHMLANNNNSSSSNNNNSTRNMSNTSLPTPTKKLNVVVNSDSESDSDEEGGDWSDMLMVDEVMYNQFIARMKLLVLQMQKRVEVVEEAQKLAEFGAAFKTSNTNPNAQSSLFRIKASLQARQMWKGVTGGVDATMRALNSSLAPPPTSERQELRRQLKQLKHRLARAEQGLADATHVLDGTAAKRTQELTKIKTQTRDLNKRLAEAEAVDRAIRKEIKLLEYSASQTGNNQGEAAALGRPASRSIITQPIFSNDFENLDTARAVLEDLKNQVQMAEETQRSNQTLLDIRKRKALTQGNVAPLMQATSSTASLDEPPAPLEPSWKQRNKQEARRVATETKSNVRAIEEQTFDAQEFERVLEHLGLPESDRPKMRSMETQKKKILVEQAKVSGMKLHSSATNGHSGITS